MNEAVWKGNGEGLRYAIVGAGMSGILAAVKLIESGNENVTVFEKAADLGGTGASVGRHIRTTCAFGQRLKGDTPGAKHPFGGPHAGESGVGSNAGPISVWRGIPSGFSRHSSPYNSRSNRVV